MYVLTINGDDGLVDAVMLVSLENGPNPKTFLALILKLYCCPLTIESTAIDYSSKYDDEAAIKSTHVALVASFHCKW